MSRVSSLSSPFLLGFDEIERVLDRVTRAADGYPPYNIERIARDEANPERLRITLGGGGFPRGAVLWDAEGEQVSNPRRERGTKHPPVPASGQRPPPVPAQFRV